MPCIDPMKMKAAMELVDGIVHVYLSVLLEPLLSLHKKWKPIFMEFLSEHLNCYSDRIPIWLTTSVITNIRTASIMSVVVLLSLDHTILPCVVVIVGYLGGCFGQVVGRSDTEEEAVPDSMLKENSTEGFEVVRAWTHHSVPSQMARHLSHNHDAFMKMICDKMFLIVYWFSLVHLVGPSTHCLKFVQYATLISFILIETSSTVMHFRRRYAGGGVTTPKVEGWGVQFGITAAAWERVNDVKLVIEIAGTVLFTLSITRYFGVLLLLSVVPLAYQMMRRQFQRRVVYVQCDRKVLDHIVLKFWAQAQALGSHLVVGIPGDQEPDILQNICALPFVDRVLVHAPSVVDLCFLEQERIDFCVMCEGQSRFTTGEVVNSHRVIVVDKDDTVRLLQQPRSVVKED